MADGAADLAIIAAKLKAMGAGGLKIQMVRGLRSAAKPLVDDVKQAALAQLPHGGGLNQQVAGQKVTLSVTTSARTAGVRLKTTAPDTAQTDAGYVRHPTFGRRGKGEWKTQQIPSAIGWWSRTLENGKPTVVPELLAVMNEVAAEICDI